VETVTLSIWAFLEQGEIDEAPDGEEGFVHLVRLTQERLDSKLGQLDSRHPEAPLTILMSRWNFAANSAMRSPIWC